MDSPYLTVAVKGKQELLQHRDDILDLFRLCFNQDLDKRLWEWAYLDNPCGDPYVHLAYYGDSLVGHYAIIPQRYSTANQHYQLALSMTTMVHASHRRARLFNQLAESCYTEAAKNGVQGVVGFPNNQSAPGFKKRLHWQCNDDYCLATIEIDEKDVGSGCIAISRDEFMAAYTPPREQAMLALGDDKVLDWRLSKPGTDYILLKNQNGMLAIAKPYSSILDLVYYSNEAIVKDVQGFARKSGFTAMTHFARVGDNDSYPPYQAAQYRFGYRLFEDSELEFEPQLIMSDVF